MAERWSKKPAEAEPGDEELREELSIARETISALVSGQVDAVFDGAGWSRVPAREARGTLRQSEQLLGAIFDNALDGIVITDADGRFIEINPAVCDIFGASRHQLLGRRFADFALPEEDLATKRRRFLERGRDRGNVALRRPDGEIRHLEYAVTARVLDEYNVSILRDVTDRVRADAERREAEERLQAVVDNAPLVLFTLDEDGNFTFSRGRSRASGESVGHSLVDLYGDVLLQKPSGDAVPLAEAVREVLEGGRSVSGAVVYRDTAYDLYLDPRWESGRVSGAVGVAIDVTERDRATEQLRRSRARLERLFESDVVAMATWTDRGVIREANRAFLRLMGLERADLDRDEVHWDDLVPADRTPVHEHVAAVLADSGACRPFEYRLRGQSGRRVPVLIGAAALDEWDEASGIALIIDLSERHRAQKALRSTAEMLQTVVESAPIGIVGLRMDGRVELWNRAATTMLGWTAAEVVRDGVPGTDEEREALLEAVREGRSYENVPARRTTRSGATIDVLASQAPRRDAEGRLAGAIITFADVSERRQLEQQFLQSQKMEAIGRLAGGVAHDFNNMLAAIQGFASVVLDELPRSDPMREDINEILGAAERAGELTRRLLAMSRRRPPRLGTIDAIEAIRGFERMLQRSLGEDVELVTAYRGEDATVRGDLAQLEQIVLNLAVNARDAMPDGGRLSIAVEGVDVVEDASEPILEPGSYVRIDVADTGVGMDEETVTHVFEPFFTTKGPEEGTGLGLSTVYGLAQQSGGHVAIDTSPGRGTTISVYLPRVSGPSRPVRPGRAAERSLRGEETVLVVEDEGAVRRMITHILDRHGYRVLEAANAGEALLAAERHGDAIDLVVTDVVMPRMSGIELIRRLRADRPALRALLISGYTDSDLPDDLPDLDLLPKPFHPNALLRRLRELLAD